MSSEVASIRGSTSFELRIGNEGVVQIGGFRQGVPRVRRLVLGLEFDIA